MIDPTEIRHFYQSTALRLPKVWNLSRKHVRVALPNRRFLKLNNYRHRINENSLRRLCAKLTPVHVYMSVLDWLFPERVGTKYKAKYALPIGGEYVVDVDSHVLLVPHDHNRVHSICIGCLDVSRRVALHICEAIEDNYRDVYIAFSGRRGFHIHVLDFDLRDWTHYNARNPIKSHEVARFMYTRYLAARCHGFDRSHFIVSTDPMRIITAPNSVNGESGLVCLSIGNRKDLEHLVIEDLVARAQFTAHPELYDSIPVPLLAGMGGG